MSFDKACEILGWSLEDQRKGWPDHFTVEDLAALHYPNNNPKRNSLIAGLKRSIADGEIQANDSILVTQYDYESVSATHYPQVSWTDSLRRELSLRPMTYTTSLLSRETYRQWLGAMVVPSNSPLQEWFVTATTQAGNPQDETQKEGIPGQQEPRPFEPKLFPATKEENTPGRLELQILAISAAIDFFGYPRMAIPRGGKAKVRNYCLLNKMLFTADGFKRAWRLNKDICVENPDKYHRKK